ncbi:MAG TPA: hypothetical protein VNL98_07295, partial [Gemmatimonadales bacterium]|nr:hypothetical protein [Gemmatimonadales bacterium]
MTRQRCFARVVRLEIEQAASPDLRRWLADKLSIEPADVYDMPDGSSVQALAEVAEIPRPDLRFPPFRPVVPAPLAGVQEGAGPRLPPQAPAPRGGNGAATGRQGAAALRARAD